MLTAPRHPRDMVELLGLLDGEADLDALLARIDWEDVTPRQIYQGVLGRLPELAKFAVATDDYSPMKHARDALTSGEYQKEVRERLLNAIPEKQRLVFIHVPKCAGTDLIENLTRSYPRLYEDLSKSQWTSTTNLLLCLRDLARQLDKSDSIFVHGHVPLNWYLERQLCRFTDRFFTVVRDPLEIMVSQVNYVFKRFYEAPRCLLPDSREWADLLGIKEFDRKTSKAELLALGKRMLHDQRIVPPNYICTYLGSGTAESAMESTARCDIEITDLKRYNAWLKQTWGFDTVRANKSVPILSLRELDPEDRAYLESIAQEDVTIYKHITHCLDASGGLSIRGSDLYRSMTATNAPKAAAEPVPAG